MAWVPSVSRTSLNAQNTAESTSCALSTKIKPDSRGLVPAIHPFVCTQFRSWMPGSRACPGLDPGPGMTSPNVASERISPREPRDDFHVRRVAELADRRDRFEPVAPVEENARVAGERRGIAGNGDHERYAGA